MTTNCSRLSLVAALLACSDAFVSPHYYSSVRHEYESPLSIGAVGPSVDEQQHPSLSSSSEASSMRQDIEAMRQQAKRRLQALNQQMDELKEHVKDYEQQEAARKKEEAHQRVVKAASASLALESEEQHELHAIGPLSTIENQPHSLDSIEGDWVETPLPTATTVSPPTLATALAATSTSTTSRMVDTELLSDTRWKIAFNIGRELGTWMPKEWAMSGDRLLFHVVVDFADQPLYERDDFLQGPANAKVLRVVEAWANPVGVGRNSQGRQAIRVKPTGGYKVLPGMGPLGTNIVRFYIELDEEVKPRPDSDVSCPRGRVYATCGYFPSHQRHAGVPTLKEIAEEEHHIMMVRYEQLQRQLHADDRIFSLDQFKLMRDSYHVKRELEQSTRRLLEARQRDPGKAQLRLARNGRVGLTKEGGVCRKITKGVAQEYHILGRIELACIDKHESHDEYQELVEQLRP